MLKKTENSSGGEGGKITDTNIVLCDLPWAQMSRFLALGLPFILDASKYCEAIHAILPWHMTTMTFIHSVLVTTKVDKKVKEKCTFLISIKYHQVLIPCSKPCRMGGKKLSTHTRRASRDTAWRKYLTSPFAYWIAANEVTIPTASTVSFIRTSAQKHNVKGQMRTILRHTWKMRSGSSSSRSR